MKRSHHHLMMYLLLVFLFVISLGLVSYLRSNDGLPQSFTQATSSYTLQSDVLTPYSLYEDQAHATFFNMAAAQQTQSLYSIEGTLPDDVLAFIEERPVYQVAGETASKQLVPDAPENLRIKETLTDADINAQFALNEVDNNATHYFLEQTRCGDIPVFGAFMNIHISESSDIYAMSGALAKGAVHCDRVISKRDAEAIAREAFVTEHSSNGLFIQESYERMYNAELARVGTGDTYLTHYVALCNNTYCGGYFVDKKDGVVRDQIQLSSDAKNRYIHLGSSIQRREGDAPVSNQDVNKAYDIMGEVWDYYNGDHGRDSWDDRGSLLHVQLNQCNDIQAFWQGGKITSCTAIADTDVLAHEFQHGVTQATSGFIYRNESGAMNEGLSDIFGATIDSDDWLMGEEGIRPIRSLENPPQFGHPDTMVSSRFYCGSQDNGGVHTNSGVLNKAFYLMSDGGTFKGCTMNGLGRNDAAKIFYKAITTYLRGNSNATYKDMYADMNKACNDIYGAGSAQCENVKAAMQATYMDQSSRCSGGSSSAQATCSGDSQPPIPSGSPSPTDVPQGPTPTGGVPNPSPSVTTAPSPTEEPRVLKQAPLLSTLSSPQFVSGQVSVSDAAGGGTTITAQLTASAFQDLNLENLGIQNTDGVLSFDDVILDIQGRLIGETVQETGAFVQRGDTVTNEYTYQGDISDFHSYQVYFTATSNYDELPVLVADITPEGDSVPSTQAVILDLSLKMQGIDRQPPATEAQLVRVGLSGGDLEETVYKRAVFRPDAQGVWTGRVIFEGVGSMTDGAIRIKGPKHSQKKYCDNIPTEINTGLYICEGESIVLQRGVNKLDFTQVTQPAGDVNQDGRVNAVDINLVRSSIGSTAADALYIGDMNNDGIINSIDDSLNIFTLSTRADQNE